MTRSRKGFHPARPVGHLQRHALAAAVVLALCGAAQAQMSTATITGQVSSAQAPARAGLVVLATNLANGNTQRTTTRADGSYVLAGLAPGAYQLSIDGQKSQQITVAVGETAQVNLTAGGQQITIVGALDRKDVRNSEVGTNVSPRTINALPQVTRNFLAFADLAPGARFEVEGDMATVRGGAQDRNNINVYIDGVSQKNNILRGGALGMDSSRGNPFPQSAIAEYKVITQNYKAEFDQVSATAITAVTKSGTNTLQGEVFYDFTNDKLTAKNPQEKQNEANGNKRVPFKQQQYGFSIGGPIKKDVAHFFFAAEGKDISKPRNVSFANVTPPVPQAGLGGTFYALQGSYNQTFEQPVLALGRLDLELGNDQHLDLTLRLRKEDDFIAEDTNLSAPGNDKTRRTEEQRLDLRHTLARDQFVNEARVGYELYQWNPRSVSTSPLTTWYISATDTANNNSERAFLKTGGSPDAQDRKQTGLLLQNDFTYTGLAGHTIKAGAKLKFMEYDLQGTPRSVDSLHKLIDKDTGEVVIGQNPNDATTDWFRREPAIAPVGVTYKNKQFGIYLQDDWKINRHLELNLGVRWDYETNPLNNDYVTPAALVAALNRPDITRYGIAPTAGQTYAQSLAKGGIDINDYIATGSRKKFTGALAPRLGLSYDVKGDRATVVYAGYGRAYDRAMANYALDELQRSKGTGDQFMIRNDYKAPYSDQFSLGLRQAVGVWNTEVGVTHTHAKNQFNWFAGDRDPNGGFGPRANSIDPNWGAGPQGYGMLILGDFVTQQKTTAVFLRGEKPYTRESGWTAGVTYTYSDGKTTHRDWNDDIFNWSHGKPGKTGGWNPSKLVERHRLVATALTDKLPWDITLAGKLTLGSGLPRRITACPTSWDACGSFLGDPGSFRQLDMAVSKGFKVPGGELSLRLDVLNLFNTVSWTQYDDWGGGPGNPQNQYGGDNANVDKRTGTSNPMRTYKLSARYTF